EQRRISARLYCLESCEDPVFENIKFVGVDRSREFAALAADVAEIHHHPARKRAGNREVIVLRVWRTQTSIERIQGKRVGQPARERYVRERHARGWNR